MICRVPPSARQVPASGRLGVALGVPCVVCFGEAGHLKTLHCQYKCHVSCLKQHWLKNVVTLGRLYDIHCPAQLTGCTSYLTQGDLLDVVGADDLELAKKEMQDLDEQNQSLIDDLKRQSEVERPMFTCSICLIDHEVEECCTLPCGHRFCFESLQYHFEIIVKERRLSKLCCPEDGCNYSLRSQEHTHMFKQVLSDESYHKLLEFLTRDIENVYECKHLGCEEHVFMDDADDFTNLKCAKGHRFCAKCDNGPHPWRTCEAMQEIADRERRQKSQDEQNEALANALAMGWKPCPKRCSYGGGVKAEEECDHVTCECGHEFCWACGVTRQVLLEHDNRWHKPSCPYHTPYREVSEAPKRRPNCPECKKMPGNEPCRFPEDDGYPESYLSNRAAARQKAHQRKQPKAREFMMAWPQNLFGMGDQSTVEPQSTASVGRAKPVTLRFHDFNVDHIRTIDFTHKPLGLEWEEGAMPITISEVVPGSEAARAGVVPGWWIHSVNDDNLFVHGYEEASRLLKEAVERLPDRTSRSR